MQARPSHRRTSAGGEPIHVLLCCNAGYFPNAAVAAVSVAANTPDRPLHVHLMTTEAAPLDGNVVERSLASFAGVTLSVWRVDRARVADLFVDGFLSQDCYLRLLAPEVLPESIERVLYLDSDVVAVEDLAPLARLDLGSALVAAAPDYPDLPRMVSPARLAALGIPPDEPYVNSGVLVMDLSGWRREGITRRMIDYVRQMGPALAFHDQDTINAVLAKRIERLDPRWNLQARMYRCGPGTFPKALAATAEARRRPAIIHFTGSEKPWLFRSRMARKGDWVRYQRLTASSGTEAVQHLPWPKRLEFQLDRRLSLLGVDYLEPLHLARRAAWKLLRQPAAGAG